MSRGASTVWRSEVDGPERFLLAAATTHTTTTAFEWGTGSDTSYTFDNLEFRDLPAQASLVMDDDKTISATFLASDSTAPVIALLGDASMSIDCGEAFVDPGATASDDRYGDITADIVVGGDLVDNEDQGS